MNLQSIIQKLVFSYISDCGGKNQEIVQNWHVSGGSERWKRMGGAMVVLA